MPVRCPTWRAASVPASGAGAGIGRRAPSSSLSRGGVIDETVRLPAAVALRTKGRVRAGALTLGRRVGHALASVSLDEHRSAFVDALLARDSARARRAVDAALAAG